MMCTGELCTIVVARPGHSLARQAAGWHWMMRSADKLLSKAFLNLKPPYPLRTRGRTNLEGLSIVRHALVASAVRSESDHHHHGS